MSINAGEGAELISSTVHVLTAAERLFVLVGSLIGGHCFARTSCSRPFVNATALLLYRTMHLWRF